MTAEMWMVMVRGWEEGRAACSQPSTRPATLLSPVLHTGNM